MTSIDLAAALLGGRVLKNLVLNASVFKTFEGLPGKQRFDHKEFWAHSTSCALLARLLAQRVKQGIILEPEETFAAGLLHDVGKIVMEQFITEDFIRVMEIVQKEEISFFEAETQANCINHAELGGALAQRWGLANDLFEAIRLHHAPMREGEAHHLACAVALADQIHHNLDAGGAEHGAVKSEFHKMSLNPTILQELNLGEEDVSSVLTDFHEAMESDELLTILSE